ncbi:MAG: pentapeptide repeat-containing protein, partial [Paracoccaceae bacterium]
PAPARFSSAQPRPDYFFLELLDPVLIYVANLVRAQMQGANLVSAQLQGAVLVEAQLQGADLEGAQLQGARCTGARVAGALLQEANIACRPDGRMDVTGAIGDERTTVLPGQQIASCWVEPPATLEATLATLEATLEATLARIPEGWRDRFLDQWMCGDRRPRPTGRWVIACPQMSDEFGDYRERLASHDPTAIDGACYRPVSEKALASWRAPEPPFARRRVAD